MLECLGEVSFPENKIHNVNMMPFNTSDIRSLPEELRVYWPIIQKCNTTDLAYLSVSSSFVKRGEYQRRRGIHTEAIASSPWGGGWGNKGVYMASTDGRCRVWDIEVCPRTDHGNMPEPLCSSVIMEPNKLYRISDLTPHEALPALIDGHRQWVRVVADEVDIWFAQHNTPNPFGIQPNARVTYVNKFK